MKRKNSKNRRKKANKEKIPLELKNSFTKTEDGKLLTSIYHHYSWKITDKFTDEQIESAMSVFEEEGKDALEDHLEYLLEPYDNYGSEVSEEDKNQAVKKKVETIINLSQEICKK